MLFDNNMGFVSYDLGYKNNNVNNKKIISLEDGFKRGNLFNDEYIPYKNYKEGLIKPSNDRDKLMQEIMMINFAIIDMNLYLDLNPNDFEMLQKFQNLVTKSNEKENEYIRLYGPLTLKETNGKNKFNWIDDPWPWQREGGKYV